MILGIVIGLVVGILFAALVFGIFGSTTQADLESDKWRLEQKVWRLKAELAQRGEVS